MSLIIHLRFYEELNDYLPEELRKVAFPCEMEPGSKVMDLLSRYLVPQEEIDLILLNGRSVGFNGQLHAGDRVSVYPVFESFDISGVQTVREKPLRQSRFILDVHLGKLAYHLRMLGFDTLYRTDYQDEDLVRISVQEKRTLLSKDRRLLSNEELTHCYEVKEINPRRQLIEVLHRFDLYNAWNPFTRCLLCNTILIPIDKESVIDHLPEKVQLLFQEFTICRSCERIYWKGSHYKRMMEFIDDIRKVRELSE